MLSLPADGRADEDRRALQGAKAQRKRLTAATVFFFLALAVIFHEAAYEWILPILGLVAAEAVGFFLLRATNARFPRVIIPAGAALIFSASVTAMAVISPAANDLRFGFMFMVAGALMTVIAPTRRSAGMALIVMTVTGVAGAIVASAMTDAFDGRGAAACLIAAFLLPLLMADRLEDARREASALQGELARRATSDEITGVSNRAHISLLAQNEFARARRYGEPYACLAIEIENYEALLAARGQAAFTAIVQVFTGYCVVVMRHCDSFGRLTPGRFLALLPETPAAGAHTLASRMCRDLSALDVAFGGEKLSFSVAIGCTEMHAVDRWAGDMLRRAEQGLMDAFERGGNCAVFAAVPVHQPLDETEDQDPPDNSPVRD